MRKCVVIRISALFSSSQLHACRYAVFSLNCELLRFSFPERDWVEREAYLELHRREKFGLPLVDPDVIPRERMVLPSDEELGDFEITI